MRPFGLVATSRRPRSPSGPRCESTCRSKRRKVNAGSTCCGRLARKHSRAPNTRFVCAADSEADIYELLVEAQAEPREVEWIVRACQNRALEVNDEKNMENDGLADIAANHLREQVLAQPVLFTQTIKVRGRKAKVGCEDRGRRQPRDVAHGDSWKSARVGLHCVRHGGRIANCHPSR